MLSIRKLPVCTQALSLSRVFGLSKPNSESRRADSNRLPLPITSEKQGVAGHCSDLPWLAESFYLSGIFFTGLHAVAEHCALGDVEVM